MSTTVTEPDATVEPFEPFAARERFAATLSTLMQLSRVHDLRLPTSIRDNDGDGQHLELAVPSNRRGLACAWAAILGLTIVSDHRQADGTVYVDAWTHAGYGRVWLGWHYIRMVSYDCPPQPEPVEPLPAHLDPIVVAERVHDSALDAGDGMPEPCQPSGCDNGYHLPGCTYAIVDEAGAL